MGASGTFVGRSAVRGAGGAGPDPRAGGAATRRDPTGALRRRGRRWCDGGCSQRGVLFHLELHAAQLDHVARRPASLAGRRATAAGSRTCRRGFPGPGSRDPDPSRRAPHAAPPSGAASFLLDPCRSSPRWPFKALPRTVSPGSSAKMRPTRARERPRATSDPIRLAVGRVGLVGERFMSGANSSRLLSLTLPEHQQAYAPARSDRRPSRAGDRRPACR